MDKRLTRIDLMFALGFLFMLVVAVAAFFYGVKVGASQAESRHEKATALPQAAAASVSLNAYQLQDLVSFYHTVFLPYREFLDDWQSAQQEWLSDESADRSAQVKELVRSAKAEYESVKVAYVPQVSPLLKDAQNQYLKSLKLYADGLSAYVSSANQATADIVLEQINANAYIAEAQKLSLAAQKQYYESMVKWGATVDIDIPEESKDKTSIDLAGWKKLPLLIKNELAAEYMQERSLMTGFLPQDLAARIDSFVASGQAAKMKLKSMSSVADLLTQTDAVRKGDFLASKVRLYDQELLPQLPFFSSDK
ncbi:hypothetical protein COLU111180_07945 [Cohnella lubricantis]|uniref:Uncharacterized protein n=1 Tax=Cohnella lubricantis TaxID=2163172 RepID=A0A841T891_9BACL|nr:hypothetical protein [Cohnella lubricantis]MBB6677713.1 hypothetical protein [Cohnella lubricantis]MBP2117675.1 hypothetical protein [Cohnella lubricantis]